MRLRGPENSGCSGISSVVAGATVLSKGALDFGESSPILFCGLDAEDACCAEGVLESAIALFGLRSPAFAAGRLGSFVTLVVLSDSVRLPLLAVASLEYPAQSSLFWLHVSQNGRSPEQHYISTIPHLQYQHSSRTTTSSLPLPARQTSSSNAPSLWMWCAIICDESQWLLGLLLIIVCALVLGRLCTIHLNDVHFYYYFRRN
jgi:hypothetical protein